MCEEYKNRTMGVLIIILIVLPCNVDQGDTVQGQGDKVLALDGKLVLGGKALEHMELADDMEDQPKGRIPQLKLKDREPEMEKYQFCVCDILILIRIIYIFEKSKIYN